MTRKTTKEWQRLEDMMERYNPYMTVSIGVVDVDPSKIVGLSLWTPDTVYNDHKMDRLIELIEENGWQDRQPKDLELIRFPNGEYSVCNGGNHRSLLARERGYSSIKAHVIVLIPESEMRPEIFDFIKDRERKTRLLLARSRKLQREIDEKGILPEDAPEWVAYERISEEMNELDAQEEGWLREEARRLGYL